MKKKKIKIDETVQEQIDGLEEFRGELIVGYVEAALKDGHKDMYVLGQDIYYQLNMLYG